MQDGQKAAWSIPYVSVAFFPSLKQNFIAYCSSKVSDCIFEIDQLWQSGFSRVYSNSCCRCSFELELIKIGQSSHKMYCNDIVNFQESTTILNACTKNVRKLSEVTIISLHHYISEYWMNANQMLFMITHFINQSLYLSINLSVCSYLYIILSQLIHIYLSIYLSIVCWYIYIGWHPKKKQSP